MNTRTLIFWFSLSFAGILFGIIALPAAAQGDAGFISTATPQPSPTGNGGSAVWTIGAMTFTSDYPRGFSFAVEASSTGGKISSAGVVWRYAATSSRTRRLGQVDASGRRAVATWQPGIQDAVPPWVSVEYWWLLADEAGNTYETPHQFAEYADNTRQWSRAESDDIVVIWQEGVPDSVGPTTIAAMREQRVFYEQNWPKPLGFKPRAIIFANFETWREALPGDGFGDAVGRTSDGATVQVYLPDYGPNYLAYSVVLHEVAHLYQDVNGGSLSRQPFWLIEGNAVYFERSGWAERAARVRDMAQRGNLPTLQGDGPSARGRFAWEAYDIGAMFFRWLEAAYGPTAHRQMWTLIGAGRSWRDALRAVTGMPFIDVETAFRTWLGAPNPVAPTLPPEPTLFFLPTPTYEPTPRR